MENSSLLSLSGEDFFPKHDINLVKQIKWLPLSKKLVVSQESSNYQSYLLEDGTIKRAL